MMDFLPALRRKDWMVRPSRDLFDRFFEGFDMPSMLTDDSRWVPAFDVSETDGEYHVRAEMPGMDRKDIQISLSNGLLTVSGEKKQENEEKTANFHRKENYYGSFCRSMQIPGEVETEKVEASYTDGVLKIVLPKSETAKPKRIEIQG